ncbi:MAG: dephospho-CoA kinase [Gemmatimonadetes bacterium]|nr:dephospho-CoA kinase [Gemmatimonadota bacterium]
MDALTTALLDLLPRVGPALLFVLALLETCFVTGLVVPAGVALLLASALAAAGTLSLPVVVASASAGALAGDSIGFWVGRRVGARFLDSDRALGGLTPDRRRRIDRILAGEPLVSVALARVVSFVRTLMPMAAGASPLAYRRFLLFDVLGVVAWAALYVGIGWVAGESWETLNNALGLVGVGVFLLAMAWLWLRRRRRRGAPLSVALTGNVAAGKSSVAEVWRQAGVPLVSADALARDASAPGSEGLAAISAAFGPEAIAADGSLDRGWMRDRVFRDPEARARLEGILHPRIQTLRERWVERQRRAGARWVAAEIPLLFEAGLEDQFDVVVLVDAPVAERRRRLIDERGLDPEEADRVIAAQMDPLLKRSRSDYVIDNDGDRAHLRERAAEVLERVRKRS